MTTVASRGEGSVLASAPSPSGVRHAEGSSEEKLMR